MLKILFAVACLAVVAFIVIRFVQKYGQWGGTTFWEKVLDAFHQSQTILWARLMMLLSGLMGGLPTFAAILNAPGVQEEFKSLLGGYPQAISAVMFIVAFGAEIARRRPASTDPLKP